jgi:hypothetical protein
MITGHRRTLAALGVCGPAQALRYGLMSHPALVSQRRGTVTSESDGSPIKWQFFKRAQIGTCLHLPGVEPGELTEPAVRLFLKVSDDTGEKLMLVADAWIRTTFQSRAGESRSLVIRRARPRGRQACEIPRTVLESENGHHRH